VTVPRSNEKPVPEATTRLRALVGRILDEIDARPPADVAKAAWGLGSYVTVDRPGKPALCGTPREIWKTSDKLAKALAARGPTIEALALTLLVAIDVDAALPLFEEFLRGDWSSADATTAGHQLLIGLSQPWNELAPRIPDEAMLSLFRAGCMRLGGLTERQLDRIPLEELIEHVRAFDFTGGLSEEVKRIFRVVARRAPPTTIAELWLAGRAPEEALSAEAIASVPLDALVKAIAHGAIGYLHVDDAERFCRAHPALATIEASLSLLERLGADDGHAARAFTRHLVRVMVSHRHLPAIPLLRRLRQAAGEDAAIFTDALLRFGDRPTLEALAETLAPTAKKLRLRWDLHHTTPALRDPIRAMFALSRERSTEAFAPFFSSRALATETGAKIALDILLLGQGTVTDHGGTVLRSGDEPWLSLDPRWRDVVEGLRSHPRLRAFARRRS
jgi:hypothetical protein